jgi:hypothetical protein
VQHENGTMGSWAVNWTAIACSMEFNFLHGCTATTVAQPNISWICLAYVGCGDGLSHATGNH